jgi:hypothetical protein
MNQRNIAKLTRVTLCLGVWSLAGCDDGRTDLGGSAQNVDAVCVASGTTPLPVLTPKTVQLWPPNHKFHSIAVEDCVSVADACETNLNAEFIWASSDEPVDDLGDGHFAPDILFDSCHRVQVRSERQGPKNGRVYKLGVRVVDPSGNAVESQCSIVVDHDQRGVVGADDGESYRIVLNGQGGLPSCDGTTDVPPPPPPADAGVPGVVDAGGPPLMVI